MNYGFSDRDYSIKIDSYWSRILNHHMKTIQPLILDLKSLIQSHSINRWPPIATLGSHMDYIQPLAFGASRREHKPIRFI